MQIQETVANPIAPERESTIDKSRAVVNHDAIRKAKPTGTADRQRGEYAENRRKVPNAGSYDRVREFPGQSLHVEDGELKLQACRTKLLLKILTIKNHYSRKPHTANLRTLNKAGAENQGATENLLHSIMQDAVHDMRMYANDRIRNQQTDLEAENIKVFKAAKLVISMYMKQRMYTMDDISE